MQCRDNQSISVLSLNFNFPVGSVTEVCKWAYVHQGICTSVVSDFQNDTTIPTATIVTYARVQGQGHWQDTATIVTYARVQGQGHWQDTVTIVTYARVQGQGHWQDTVTNEIQVPNQPQ